MGSSSSRNDQCLDRNDASVPPTVALPYERLNISPSNAQSGRPGWCEHRRPLPAGAPPIYSGIIALAAGSSVPSGNPVTVAATVALTGWLMAKARWEEHHLRVRYPAYDDYAARTPRFVPFWPFGADRR